MNPGQESPPLHQPDSPSNAPPAAKCDSAVGEPTLTGPQEHEIKSSSKSTSKKSDLSVSKPTSSAHEDVVSPKSQRHDNKNYKHWAPLVLDHVLSVQSSLASPKPQDPSTLTKSDHSQLQIPPFSPVPTARTSRTTLTWEDLNQLPPHKSFSLSWIWNPLLHQVPPFRRREYHLQKN